MEDLRDLRRGGFSYENSFFQRAKFPREKQCNLHFGNESQIPLSLFLNFLNFRFRNLRNF